MNELKPLICQCCGGRIDRHTMMCPYCGAHYIKIPEPSSYVSRSEADSFDSYIEKMKREHEKLVRELAMEKFRHA